MLLATPELQIPLGIETLCLGMMPRIFPKFFSAIESNNLIDAVKQTFELKYGKSKYAITNIKRVWLPWLKYKTQKRTR